MVDWQWIIYGLAIIFLIFLFCLYRNNFYLWRYLVKSCKFFEIVEKKLNTIFFIIVFIFLVIVLMFIIYKVSSIPEKSIKEFTEIIKVIKNVNREITTHVTKNIFKINTKLLIDKHLIIKYLTVPTIILCLYVLVFWLFNRDWTSKVTLKIFLEIIVLILLIFCGIKTLDWFQKLNINLTVLFIQFCFIMYILYCLKIIILFTIKSIIKTILILLFFLFSMFLPMIGILILNYKDMNTTGIRVTKGNLETLKNRKIELFFKEGRKEFEIENKGNKLWIKNENDTEFKNSEIQKILFNKGNEGVLFMKKENKDENKNVEFVYINNENTKIKDRQNNEVEADVSIEGKIIIVKDSKIDENNIKNYIFINSWQDLNKIERIGIEEDNFYINLLNLVLFLFSILYFWLKLYGKKSSEYYDKKIINEIKNTPIILDRNKYDKFFTLSMFGLTIPNIWKTVSIKNIDEIRDQSSVYIKMFVFLLIFGVVLFCIITSKEISECVKELENKKPKRKRKN